MLHYRNQSLKSKQKPKSARWGSFTKCINFYIEFYQVGEQKKSLLELPWRQGQGQQHNPEWTKELWLSGQNSILYFTFCCSVIIGVLLTLCSDWGSQMRFKLPDPAVRAVLLMCLHFPPLPSWRLFHILLQATQTAPSGTCTCPASFLPKPQHPFPCSPLVSSALQPSSRILNGWLLPK